MTKDTNIKNNAIKDIHSGHRERLRDEFIQMGIGNDVPPHKVLELILFFTIPRKDTNELAHIVLNYFNNSFPKVMEASIEELVASSKNAPPGVPKITRYTAEHIKLILDIAQYYYGQKAKEEKWLLTKAEASTFLLKNLVNKTVETAYMLCLDNANRFLTCQKIPEGDEFAVSISARQLVKKATQIGATKVLLAHNHPRGVALPSPADIAVTKQIYFALSGIDVKLLDHIIIADNEYVSLSDSAEYSYIFEL